MNMFYTGKKKSEAMYKQTILVKKLGIRLLRKQKIKKIFNL
jgi:hypothetical protein